MELNTDYTYRHLFFCAKLTAAHYLTPHNTRWAIHLIGIVGIFSLYFAIVMYSIVFHDIHGDLANLCANGSWIMIYCEVMNKYIISIAYKETFVMLFDRMRRDYDRAELLTPEERKIVSDNAKFSVKLMGYWKITVILCVGLFLVKPVTLMTYYTATKGFEFVPIMKVTYPPPLNGERSLTFSIIDFILAFYFAVFAGLAYYVGLMPLGPIFCSHACGQLELLKIKAMKVFPENETLTPKERAERIKTIAIELQDIFEFVEWMRPPVKMSYEITLKGFTVITPVLLYISLETFKNGDFEVAFISVMVGSAFQSSFPLYCGTRLITKGEELRDGFYFSGWEGMYERTSHRSLLIMMTRLERQVALRTVFRVISLDLLTDALGTAYSIFNLLCAAIE